MKPLLVFSVIIQSLLTYLEQPWPILSPKTLLWSKQTFTQSCAHHMSLTESIFFTAFSLIFCLLRLYRILLLATMTFLVKPHSTVLIYK